MKTVSHFPRRAWIPRTSKPLVSIPALFFVIAGTTFAQGFFQLKDVRPGQHGVGRTVFHGNRIEEFQVEILGVLENLTPKQSIILAKLSGGPLEETGVMQGMSGSPVYIDGKLLGAVALGFPFAKQPIAGIQPIEQMIADSESARQQPAVARGNSRVPSHLSGSIFPAALAPEDKAGRPPATVESKFGTLTEMFTPLSVTGFGPHTIQAFAPEFRKLGLDVQEGVSSGSPSSQSLTGTVQPGSMISVGLLTGDMTISADGTVTYVDGKRIYAFGHRFLDAGSVDLPFARADVVALLPTLNSSFKLSSPREWVGSITSDRSSAIAGEIGRPARMLPLTISVRSRETSTHDYHLRVINDRLLTPFITQTAVSATIDRTERTLGAGTLRLSGQVRFEGSVPPLLIHDVFISDNALAQQVSVDAVVTLGFALGAGFSNLQIKDLSYTLEPVEQKRQLKVAQVWTSASQVRPGDSVDVSVVLQGEDGLELTRTAKYQVPVGIQTGTLNLTVTDALGLNAPEFAGISQTSFRSADQLIAAINNYRSSEAVYLRVWRQQPSFTLGNPLPGGEITDPPPSISLVLSDTSSSPTTSAAQTIARGSELAEVRIPVDRYAVSGSRTVQVEVKD
jgi:hypothetical protein